MATSNFLPFTRPAIDEATIAAVGDVLRSGWISSGPKVREFEAQLSAPVRRPARACDEFGHRRDGDRIVAGECRAWR